MRSAYQLLVYFYNRYAAALASAAETDDDDLRERFWGDADGCVVAAAVCPADTPKGAAARAHLLNLVRMQEAGGMALLMKGGAIGERLLIESVAADATRFNPKPRRGRLPARGVPGISAGSAVRPDLKLVSAPAISLASRG